MSIFAPKTRKMYPLANNTRSFYALENHCIKGTFFCAFSSKSATDHLSPNDYTQCTSEHFRRCSFTGKEKDEETGYGYFGARYMDHELMTMWLSVDPMADKYPNVSPYAYCAWNPVKLVDPDGREIHIVGDKKYQTKVIALLNQLANSGLAGKYLVHEALKLEKTFTFIQPRDNSSFEEDAINRNGKNGEISFILFDAYSSGTFDEANGGVEKTPLTTMAHELAHFVFPNNGHILMDNGYNGGPAGEVKAVEWENMVREDLGMPLRRKYAGMDVFGKEISPTKQYEKSYTLTKKRIICNVLKM